MTLISDYVRMETPDVLDEVQRNVYGDVLTRNVFGVVVRNREHERAVALARHEDAQIRKLYGAVSR